MKELTSKYQIIRHGGKPLFVLVPYDEFLNLVKEQKRKEPTIPHEVVGMVVKNGWSLLKAWRKYLGLTQKELAEKVGISQSALSQLERKQNHRNKTLEKIAEAMGLEVELLIDKDDLF